MNKYTVPRNCELCGEPFLARKDLVNAGLARWCSRKCATRARPPFETVPLEDRFWPKVSKQGPIPAHRPELGRCWLWTGGKDPRGYGRVALGRRPGGMALSHRASFFLAHGRWPEPCALHHCDNPACVRPDHLFEGSYKDNMLDCSRKGRVVLPYAKGSANPAAKLTEGDVREIRRRLARGETQESIGRRFSVSQVTISRIKCDQHWRHA